MTVTPGRSASATPSSIDRFMHSSAGSLIAGVPWRWRGVSRAKLPIPSPGTNWIDPEIEGAAVATNSSPAVTSSG